MDLTYTEEQELFRSSVRDFVAERMPHDRLVEIADGAEGWDPALWKEAVGLGLAGISVTEDRTRGFEEEIKKRCPDGGLKIVASQPGDFNPDTGLKVMENILQSEKQIDAVYTHDDDMAEGVVSAIENAGR